MKNIPQEIFLQVDADGETPEDFKELQVTWATNRIYDNDLRYVSEAEMLDYGEWARGNGERFRGNLQKNGKELFNQYLKERETWKSVR